MTENEKIELAHELYDLYCELVGGKTYDGRPLPSAKEFFADPTKKLQSDAWLGIARRAVSRVIHVTTSDCEPPEKETPGQNLNS